MAIRVVLRLVFVVLAVFVASLGQAQKALLLTPVTGTQIRVDGDLREWHGLRFAELGDVTDRSLAYALGYDAQALYVAARVFDDQLVRSKQPSPAEDAVVLTLVMPRASGAPQSTEVWLYAGIVGTQAAAAALAAPGARPNMTKDIAVVEGPLAGATGYVIEARVPFSLIEGSRDFMVGRGAIRLHDVDGKPGARAVEVASARVDRVARLPPLLVEGGPNAALETFLRAKQLTTSSVRFDLLGDVADDGRLERVLVAGTFAVVAGPQIDNGAGFHFIDLPVPLAAGVLDAELRDLTGDGKGELLVRLRQQNDLGARELLEVLDLSRGQPKLLFALELAKQGALGSVEAKLDIERPGKGEAPKLVVSIGTARGLDASNFHEQPAAGVEGILLPWGSWAKRVYRWDGAHFAVLEQRPNPNAAAAHEPSAATPATAPPAQRITDAQTRGTDELIAAFRSAQGIAPSVQPRFTQHADVAEDSRLESLMLFGKNLLVIGKGYRGGTGYFYFGLPVRDGADIQHMWNGDVTGDGRAELFVRFKQDIGDVEREILLGYTFTDDGMRQILAVEVRRAQASNSVGSLVAIVLDHGHPALRIAPGVAHGWDASSYPFVPESSDGYAALLLPWKDGTVVYRYDGQSLVAHSESASGR